MSPEPTAPDETVPCPVCKASDTAPYVEKDDYVFRRCADCGYVFCHPRPTDEQLAEVYGHDREVDATFQYSKASSRHRRALGKAFSLWRYVWGSRVLDVGCGGGFMVNAMKQVGAKEAVGLDIGAKAIAYANKTFPKCTFHRGAFYDLKDIAHDFDFVFSSEVIEHVGDIDEYACFLGDALKPGGVLYITTPDIGSSRVPETVTDWDVFSPPLHIQFFDKDTLTHLLKRHGLLPIRHIQDRRGAGLKMLFRKDK